MDATIMDEEARDELADKLALEWFARMILRDCPELAHNAQAEAVAAKNGNAASWEDARWACRTSIDVLLQLGWRPHAPAGWQTRHVCRIYPPHPRGAPTVTRKGCVNTTFHPAPARADPTTDLLHV